MPRPDPLTPLRRVLESDPQFRAWNERRQREEALLRAVRKLLPRPVAERIQVHDAGGGTLHLVTTAGAIASVVRQRGPDLMAALARDGWQFSRIAVRVQPPLMPLSLEKGLPRQWDSASRRPVARLAAELPPGPLKTALTRFLRAR
jgi:hypothetical protein